MLTARRPFASRLLGWSSRRLGYGNDDPATNGEYRLLDELPAAPTVFDVGANRGDYTLAALARRPGAAVHCFEPSAVSYATLSSRLDGRATLHNCALSAAAGLAILYADEPGSEMASLYPRDLRLLGINFGGVTETITVSTLDTEAERAGVNHIDLLKIDAEGADADVIAGAEDMILKGAIDMITFEHGGTVLDAHLFVRDYYRLLGDRYDLYRILPDGLLPLGGYRESYERAEYVNMCAVRLAL